ncbi:MAG: glutamate-1-semialdehyde 2,1-aminomutase [Planctomycetes bacterium]|nr:glutamate-1-semialdehyde 2,1-aminomutase [Planctomycetota bacterium]
MSRSIARSDAAFKRAEQLMPGGVNSPVRAFRAVGGTPVFVASGSRGRIRDVDGNEYVDLVASWGPMILGHAHPEVVSAIVETARNGTSFGAPTERESELAEAIRGAFPSIERLRLVSSGTEAAMSAIRAARGFTGRNVVLKFEGCYHGHADGLLVQAGSGAATFGSPSSAGVPEAYARLTRVATYNDLEDVDRLVRDIGNDLAAIIVEPVAANMGVVPPAPGFLEGLRERCDRAGALLIFDEVITGFRLAKGGAQERFGVRADLTVLGKIIGGGMPVGAYGGRAEILARIAPLGRVYQAGTLSGNPVSVAAGIATLRLLTPDLYVRLEATARAVEKILVDSARASGTIVRVQRVGSLLTPFFGVPAGGVGIRSWNDAKLCDAAAYGRFFHAMLDRGVYLPPSAFEAMFVGGAHDDRDLSHVADAAGEAMRAANATASGSP